MTAQAPQQAPQRTAPRLTVRNAPPEVARTHAAWRFLLRLHRSHSLEPRRGSPAISLRWVESFEAFLDDVGACPEGHQPSRLDRRKPYGPGNFAWTKHTPRIGRTPRKYSFGGKTLTLRDWAAQTGVSEATLRARLNRGVSFGVAIQPTDYRKA